MAYPISSTALGLFQTPYRQVVSITLEGTEESLEITESNIPTGGMTVNRYCVSGNRIEIGSVIASELTLVLDNSDGKYDDVVFEGAELFVRVGVKKRDAKTWENADFHFVPFGYFTVDETPRKLRSITLSALDRMMLFDKKVDNSLLSFPMTVDTLLGRICDICNVVCDTNLALFPNHDYVVEALPPDEDLTYRQYLSWIAEITGTCGFMDWNGHLVLKWYEPTDTVLTMKERHDSDLKENAVTLTGVQVVDTDGEVYLVGDDGYAINIESNSLIQNNYREVAEALYDVLNGFTYTPFTATVKPMPQLYPLDMITFVDKKGVEHPTIITDFTFTLNKSTVLQGKGETATKSGYASSNPLTKRESAIINSIKHGQNLKADVASCEKTNNVLNVERYNRFNPLKVKPKALDSRVRDTIEGHPCAVFFTNTGTSTIAVGDRSLAPGATMLYFAGNMNNSKKNFKVFGQDNTAYPDQCCVEIMNNNAAECRFKANIGDDETWKGGNFEFRFPKTPTDAMKERFKEVHAWVVSTDTTAATGESLGRTVTYGEKDSLGNEITYTTDSAAYRKAKFIHEVANYFHVDNLDFHYLYTEFTCGVDNRAKNCFMSYEPDENGVWRWSFRTHYDHDTSYGNDNSGGLTFEYGLEDTDTVGNANVFNAADSVLWCNVRDFRVDELNAMYVKLDSLGCWDADDICGEFNEYQSARPEALEMEDANNKYRIPTALRYRSMMLGTKEYQRYYFIPKQSVYMASKHRGNLCTKHKISLRTNVPEGSTVKGDIAGVVPFIKMYLRCQFGNVGEYVVRAEAGQEYTLVCPDGANLNDLETYLFSSQHIAKIGSLAHVHPKFVDLSDAPLLRRAEIGSGEVGYSNTSMNTANTGGISFDNNPFLEYIDLRNIPLLTQSLNLSKLASLEEIYTTDSGITGVEFAKGAPVRVAALNNLLKKVVARGLTRLESFTMGAGAMTSIWVEDSPGINTLALVKGAPNLERGRLPDVVWADEDADVIMGLTSKAGFDEFGVDSEDFVLKGTAQLSMAAQTEIDTIRAEFPDLEVTCDEILESFTVTFQDWDGTVFEDATQEVRQYGSAVNPITAGMIPTPARASTVDTIYTFIGWDVSFNYILGDLVVTARYSEAVRTYTVKWWKDAAHTSLAASVTGVEAYGSVEYPGEDLVSTSGAIWMGWDQPTSSVVSDMDVHAVFVTPTMPDSVASGYDYLYSDNPDDNMGYSLAEFYGIISSGNAKNYFNVGDKVKIVPTTTAFEDSEIVLQVYGFNHFKLADGSGEFAPVVFGMVGLMNLTYQMNSTNTNVGGWNVTKMRTYLNETVFPALPKQWQAMIKTVQVLASEGDNSATIVTSEDNLFLFSQAEVGFNTTAVPYCNEIDADAEEVTFSIFTDNASRIKKGYNGTGTAARWWLRSPLASSSTYFCNVSNGGSSLNNSALYSTGVAFGFCI